MEKPTGKLTENETSFILRTTLLPEHNRDPNVLRFISNYMSCRNASQAARDAGLTSQSGAALRSRPDIHLAITRLTEKSVMKYGYDATEVIERVKEIATMDPLEFENLDGSFKIHMRDIAPESRRGIKKFKAKNIYGTDPNGMPIITGQIIEVEMWDKMKAIELLGREKEIFKETTRIEHDVTNNMASILLESKQRSSNKMLELQDVTPIATKTIEVEVEE